MNKDHRIEERITSTYRSNIFQELLHIANNIDFTHPRYRFKRKRSRSAGSAQALVCELALQDPSFRKKLREFMIDKGQSWQPTFIYLDYYN